MNNDNSDSESLRFSVVEGQFAVCRLSSREAIPDWAHSSAFSSITRTAEELSIICPASQVPSGIQVEDGWALLKLHGPFPLNSVGILRSVACALGDAGISILAVGTFDTDYLLIQQGDMPRAVETLEVAGHRQRSKQRLWRPVSPKLVEEDALREPRPCEVRRAHELIETAEVQGKIVLTV